MSRLRRADPIYLSTITRDELPRSMPRQSFRVTLCTSSGCIADDVIPSPTVMLREGRASGVAF